MKSVQSTTDIVVLLALAYMLFFRQDVAAGPLKTALDISLIILFVVSIVEKAFSLYLKYREKKDDSKMYKPKERDAIKKFLNEEILNTSEALEILGFTRQYLNQLVKTGELEPMKEMPRDRLFLKEDILDFQKHRRK